MTKREYNIRLIIGFVTLLSATYLMVDFSRTSIIIYLLFNSLATKLYLEYLQTLIAVEELRQGLVDLLIAIQEMKK